MKYDYEKLCKWEDGLHIPMEVKKIVNAVMDALDMRRVFVLDGDEDEMHEETIHCRNRGGYVYARGKGFTLTFCTSSYADGPETDPRYVIDFIKGLGFVIENSHGDNGMDSATNWHDTFWTYEFLYEPSRVYEEEFEIWEEEDYDND